MNGIGIDVSKRQLDVGTVDGDILQVSNSASGFAELDAWLRKHPTSQVVLEAIGGYEQPVLDFLHKADHPVVRANALRARKLPSCQLLGCPGSRNCESLCGRVDRAMQALTLARQQQEMVSDCELRRLLQADITRLQAPVERLAAQSRLPSNPNSPCSRR